MKNLIIIFLAITFSTFSFAQNEQYYKAMGANLGELMKVKPQDGWQQIANTFDRIADAEKNQWLPYYYSAYCNMILAATSEDNSSKAAQNLLDKAQESLDKAMAIDAQNSEIYALQGYIYTGRIWKNAMISGAKYTPKAHAAFEKASTLDPSNPRPHYLKGQLIFYTPSFFGGGKDNAKASLQVAYEKYKTFKTTGKLNPRWGEKQTALLLERCGVDLANNSGE